MAEFLAASEACKDNLFLRPPYPTEGFAASEACKDNLFLRPPYPIEGFNKSNSNNLKQNVAQSARAESTRKGVN